MSSSLIYFVYFITLFLEAVVVIGSVNNGTNDLNRICIPAEAKPSLNSSSCYPLNSFSKPFCKNHGIILPDYVFQTPSKQTKLNDKANSMEPLLNTILEIMKQEDCKRFFVLLSCHYAFPSCDDTTSVFRPRKICRETCLQVSKVCEKVIGWAKIVFSRKYDEYKRFLDCKELPERNAGDSPECWHYDKPKRLKGRDCLHLNGSTYNGKISVTASGIPCQSWTAQCPHRHTMNTTYPELNNAENFCRNPQNSGKQPWCFTTDRKKRWEYCNIPVCNIPVDSNCGNWSMASQCSVTCGQGFQIWKRTCTRPSPKEGERNYEYRNCTRKPCPVNGGYGNWSLNSPCNVSCGKGYEIWKRSCNNPTPKDGGSDCKILGKSKEFRECSRKPCPINGNYSDWSKKSPCNTTCGGGVEIWIRKCDNPRPQHGGTCPHQEVQQEHRPCNMAACPGGPSHTTDKRSEWSARRIGLVTVVCIAGVAFVIFLFVSVGRKIRRRRDESYVYLLEE